VILAVALGVAVIVAAVALARVRALSHHVAEVQARADGSRAKVVAGLEREAVMEERYDALSVEHTALEATLHAAEAERARLQLAVDDSSGEVARLDAQLALMGDSLANAQAAAREADAAAVAAVAAADATHGDLIKTRNEVERLQSQVDELQARPAAPDGERPEAAPRLVEGLWALERDRTERTWRQSVSLDPSDPGPFETDADPTRVAVEVEAAAVREDVGSVIDVDWQVETVLGAEDGLLLLRSAQELLAWASRTVEDGVLLVAADDDELVLSLLGPDRAVVSLDGAVVRLPRAAAG
jgi:hypothetical protein